MQSKHSIMETNEDISKNFPQGDPFRVPDGFFETFHEELTSKIRPKTDTGIWFRRMRQPLKLAASFALFVVFTWLIILFIRYNQPATETVSDTATDTLTYEYEFVDEYFAAVAMSDTALSEKAEAGDMMEFLLDKNVSYELLADYY